MEVMQNPVIAQDGHTYERSAIEEWFSRSASANSPMTGERLPNKTLIPNRSLQSAIKDFKARQDAIKPGGAAPK